MSKIHKHVRDEFARLRGKQWAAREALREAKTNVLFREYEAAEVVRLRVEQDAEPYLFGDAENERETRARIEQHGVFGIVAEARCPCCNAWRTIDSVWGFVGDDVNDNGYDGDLKRAAIDAYEART